MYRMSAAGAAVVLSLALGGVTALAQESTRSPTPTMPTGPATVTGEVNCADMDPCDFSRLSDPRVTGDAKFTDLGFSGYGQAIGRGTIQIKGPEGDWFGPGLAVRDDDQGKWVMIWTLEGSGAYEGWSFVFTVAEPGGGYNPIHGYIYHGSAPRMEWPEPSPSPSN